MQVFQLRERGAVVVEDTIEASVQFVGRVFAHEHQRRSRLWHCTQPVAAKDVGDGEVEGDDRLADGALSGEKRDVPYGDAVEHAPLALRHRLAVPHGDIDER